ncbi:MAG: ribosome small subunit-dependent GTPase A [Deltaproteobacteria bacterium]|nr:ribosome small subunit-dependent GTPase A [Deltaproteobacteria bacterium]
MSTNPLSELGFGPFFEEQISSLCLSSPDGDREPPVVARIAAEHAGGYEVWGAHGTGRAVLAGRLRGECALGVGDWVIVDGTPSSSAVVVIERVLKHRTVFTRGAAGREARVQIIAANVDRVFTVCGLDGDFNLRRIERYLARTWASGAEPAVVLSKLDLCPEAEVSARVALVERHAIGVPVYAISALQGDGLEVLRREISPGMTLALVGSSGAGKSTLINALRGEAQMKTGEVRARDGRGRHVTTHRQLVRLPGGGLLLDTPGMREIQLLDADGLDGVFGDVAAHAVDCRFRDCRHETEPGCAVKAAVADGRLEGDRLAHYRQLEREARANELRHDEHRRRKAERIWGQLSDEAERLRRWKGRKGTR